MSSTPSPTPKPATERVPLALVSILACEIRGQKYAGAIEHTWQEANAELQDLTEFAPASAEMPLTVVCDVVWGDEFTITVQYEVRSAKDWKADLAAHVRKHWSYYAGFERPPHMSEADYDREIASNPKRRDEATECLKRYALVDRPATKATALPTHDASADFNPLDARDLERAISMLGWLVLRCEKSGQPRPLAMELRKALAAINRCPGLLA